MGHWEVEDGKPDLFIDDDGRAWSTKDKLVEFDPVTKEAIHEKKEETVADKEELSSAYSKSELEQFHMATLASMLGKRVTKGITKESLIEEILNGGTNSTDTDNPDDRST